MEISPTRQAKVDEISLMLSIHAVCTMMQNRSGFFNINHHAEDMYCQILNVLHKDEGWSLVNANMSSLNNPGYDLEDKAKGICVQVTSERDLSKLNKSLGALSSSINDFYFLCFNIVPPPVKSWKKREFTFGNNQNFDVVSHVITLPDIESRCLQLEDEDLDKVWEILSSFVRGAKPSPARPQPKDDAENLVTWISQSAGAYQRFKALCDCDIISQLDSMIRPEISANWFIIDLSADLLTLKGRNLHDVALVGLINELCNICDYFAMLSRVQTSQDLETLHKHSDRGCTIIINILSAIATKDSVDVEIAKSMFEQYIAN